MEDPPPGRRPRVVKVDELAAFAEVFDVPIADLLLAPEQALTKEVADALEELGQHRTALLAAARGVDSVLRRLVPLMPTDSIASTINATSRMEGPLLDLIDISLEVEDRLRDEEIPPTSERTAHGQHHEAP